MPPRPAEPRDRCPWETLGRLASVGLAAALLCQFGLLGLRPALAERERLEAALVEIEAEGVVLGETLASLQRLDAALADPIYRERVRRLERAAAAAR